MPPAGQQQTVGAQDDRVNYAYAYRELATISPVHCTGGPCPAQSARWTTSPPGQLRAVSSNTGASSSAGSKETCTNGLRDVAASPNCAMTSGSRPRSSGSTYCRTTECQTTVVVPARG